MSDEIAKVADDDSRFSPPPAEVSNEWTDIAYGLLTEPDETMQWLCNRPDDTDQKHAAFVACWIMVLATLVSGLAQVDNVGISLVVTALVLTVIGLTNWFFVAYLLKSVSSWFKSNRSYRLCLSLIGWATLPLVFVAPLSCFHKLLGPAAYALILLPGLWSIYLQCLAFRHASKVGRSAAFSIFVFGPPVILLASIFWSGILLLSLLPMVSNG